MHEILNELPEKKIDHDAKERSGLCRVLAIDLSTPAADDDAHVREEIYFKWFLSSELLNAEAVGESVLVWVG